MIYVGIDQGGTKTQVAACDADGAIIGAATGPAAIFHLDDPDNISTARARELAEKILSRAAGAGLPLESVTAVCGGLSGLDWLHEIPVHETRLREGFKTENVSAVNDSVIALRAGSDAPNRCVVVAGTGLNIATHASDGAEFVYGYYIPDRMQGGGAMGNAVVEAITEAAAGVRPPTVLTDTVPALFACASVEQFLIRMTSRQMPFAPQSLMPTLLSAALSDGDATAKRILENFTADLARFLKNALTHHLPPGEEAELVFSGGVFKGTGRSIADSLTRILAPEFPRLRFANSRLEPVCGALLLLLDKHHNNAIPPAVKQRFNTECAQHGLLRK